MHDVTEFASSQTHSDAIWYNEWGYKSGDVWWVWALKLPYVPFIVGFESTPGSKPYVVLTGVPSYVVNSNGWREIECWITQDKVGNRSLTDLLLGIKSIN